MTLKLLECPSMDVTTILSNLNPAQEEAVTRDKKHLLVLAGAGSGKPRVLVHRIAWKIQVENFSPYSILAVTFTNKAAREMRERIDELLGMPLRGMWVGTFHGLAHRLLKAHWHDAKLPENFQILDSDDQLRLVKRVMRGMDLDEQRWPPKQAQWWINGQKDEGLRAAHIQEGGDPFLATMLRVYRGYEETCERLGVIDFAELSDGNTLKQLFDDFAKKRMMIDLLDRSISASGVQVFIGAESGYSLLDDCSVVTAPYQLNDNQVGVLGVIGPKRMAYDKVVPIVDLTAKLLGSAIENK